MQRTGLYAFIIVLLSALLWCVAILSTPFLRHTGLNQVSSLLYIFFSKICHQLPKRSIFLFGEQFPVCIRDTAIYFSFLLGTFIYPFVKKPVFKKRWPLIVFCLPLIIDGTTQLIGLRQSNTFLRILTGSMAGIILPFYIIPGIKELLKIFLKDDNKSRTRRA